MDWKLAKNYTILFLIILNIILFLANFISNNKYKISQEQKNSIISYLQKNDISIYTSLPTNHFPMEQLRATKKNYDYIDLQEIFFDNKNNIKRTEQFSNTIFSNENEILTIFPNYIFYESKLQDKNISVEKNDVLEICNNYIEKIKKYYANFSLDRVFENDAYFLIEFTQNFSNYDIFNNYVKFKIYKDGTREIYFSYLEINDFFDIKSDICSIDEALYIFSKEIKKKFTNSISIRQIDLGYYIPEITEDINFTLTPHYRILITNTNEPFYINAYTNTFVN